MGSIFQTIRMVQLYISFALFFKFKETPSRENQKLASASKQQWH
jgi:hypothetical protein